MNIPKYKEKEILKNIKQSRLKELELLDYSIKNISTQQILVNKTLTDSNTLLGVQFLHLLSL